MADITSKYQGNVASEGMQNWRGDQVSVAQGGQSIYESSSVQLAELGSRKVVGDRVFRYAKAKQDIAAGSVVEYGGERLTSIAFGSSVTQGSGLNTFTITAATAISKDTYADGYLICEEGATDANLGMMYRIKSNALGSSAGTCKLTLYDPIAYAVKLTSTWSVNQNLYLNVISAILTKAAIGVAPIDVTTGDYFWVQTWGPTPALGTAAAGAQIAASVSGRCTLIGTAGETPIGVAVAALNAATNYGLTFLTIAP